MAQRSGPAISLEKFAPVLPNGSTLAEITLQAHAGDIIAVLGHSGVGKTSLLRAMQAQIPANGECAIHARIWNVLQNDHQLFPWMTVRRNLTMACSRDWHTWAQKWNLSKQLDIKPQYLSVGQRQRFTLLRACCSGAGVLLCDEPLSAVDAMARTLIAADIRQIAQDMQVAIVWVTHDISEAVAIADRFVCITPKKTEILNDDCNETHIRASLFA